MKNQRLLAFVIGTAVGVCIFVFILLCIWFPRAMAALTAASIAFYMVMARKCYNELWPDLYKE